MVYGDSHNHLLFSPKINIHGFSYLSCPPSIEVGFSIDLLMSSFGLELNFEIQCSANLNKPEIINKIYYISFTLNRGMHFVIRNRKFSNKVDWFWFAGVR
ncbi:hypothetical protein CEXT_798471 [Caerostris extrusa]|uniref:Uncharacterized protein n=1 Tax=Caerostris extrusa TaxID=172846 RepID=A0AAV4WV89_CAEEX|nr:hypothetical protein CEXT_798471 [Caerostris extrusa]